MKIILLKEIPKLGKEGDIVEVKNGYARNYLIPQRIACEATSQKLKEIENKKLIVERRKERIKQNALEFAKKISDTSITVVMKTGEDGKLFGAVTSIDIVKGLEKEGIKIDRHNIIMEEPIKELGIYQVKIKVHSEVEAKLKVWVVKE
jgi:large subunit ribosomal protein L9